MQKRRDVLVSVLQSAIFSLVVCGLAPLRILAANMNLLWFPAADLYGTIVLLLIIVFAVIFLLSYLLSGMTGVVYPVLLGVGLALYVQCEWLHFGYGAMNGAAIAWGKFGTWAVVNTLIWVLLIAACVFLYREKRNWFFRTAVSLSAVLLILQVITGGTLLRKLNEEQAEPQNAVCLSTKGIDEVSDSRNVAVFVFDTFDDKYFKEILQKDPDFLDPLQGFTYFSNNTGMYPSAEGAIPYILSGQENRNEKHYNTYIEEAYAQTDYYHDLKAAGYDIGIYGDLRYVDSEALLPMLSNYETIVSEQISSEQDLLKQLYKAAAFRYLPHIAKGAVWYSPADFTKWKVSHTETGCAPYKTGNLDLYGELKGGQLHLNDTGKPCYRVFYCNGVKSPYTLRKDMTEDSATYLDTAKGCLNIVYEYIEQLKQLGVYDNTMILIVSGNGSTSEQLSSPVFLAKPRYSRTVMKISEAPVCQEDLFATVMTGIGLNTEEKYGRSAFRYLKDEWREREYLYYKPADTRAFGKLQELTAYSINNQKESFPKEEDYIAIEYTLGTELEFKETNPTGFDYCISGFSELEKNHTWTDEKRGVMAFAVNKEIPGDLLVSIELASVFNPPQRVIVCQKGQELFRETLQTSGCLEFIIPSEYLQDDLIELTFHLPDAISPKELGMGSDSRNLALGFESMRIQRYRGISKEEFSKILDYKLGQVLLFSEEDPTAESYCLSGFGDFESGYCWTNAEKALLGFRITEDIKDDLLVTMETDMVFNGPQEVLITMDGHELYHKVLDEAETIEFVIPAEQLQFEEIILKFDLPDAISPKELGEGSDERTLALAVKSLCIEPYRGISKEELSKILNYKLGQILLFSEEDPTAESYCLSGFGDFESGYCWTNAEKALLGFRITEDVKDDLLVTMETDMVFNGSQEVLITMDGHELYHEVLDEAETIEFTIPAELIRYEELILNFHLPDAISPYELGESGDTRDLAIGVVSMVIRNASEK